MSLCCHKFVETFSSECFVFAFRPLQFDAFASLLFQIHNSTDKTSIQLLVNIDVYTIYGYYKQSFNFQLFTSCIAHNFFVSNIDKLTKSTKIHLTFHSVSSCFYCLSANWPVLNGNRTGFCVSFFDRCLFYKRKTLINWNKKQTHKLNSLKIQMKNFFH